MKLNRDEMAADLQRRIEYWKNQLENTDNKEHQIKCLTHIKRQQDRLKSYQLTGKFPKSETNEIKPRKQKGKQNKHATKTK